MKKRFISITMAALLIIASFTGCGSTNSEEDDGIINVSLKEETVKEYDNNSRYMGDKINFSASILEPGNFYVRHRDNTCDQLYFGQANFDVGDNTSNIESVMWFKTDFNKIPTLFSGDSLIYYSEETFDEQFVFTRFEDFGYSVGVCGLKPTESYRYSISTNVDDKCTYPEGDTDAILYLSNEKATFESIGNVPLRYDPAEEEKQEEARKNKETYVPKGIYVTRIGSIANLTQNLSYDAVLYSGTIENNMVFKCDTRLLGFMEKLKTVDYSFEKENNVITINIPEEYQNGYYIINGLGIFRYVNGTEYSKETDFNIPNDDEIIDIDADMLLEQQENDRIIKISDRKEEDSTEVIDDVALLNQSVKTFKVREPGVLTIRVTFDMPELPDGYDIGAVDDPTAYVEAPNGTRYRMAYKNNEMFLEITAQSSGTYKIEFDNLYGRKPSIQVG